MDATPITASPRTSASDGRVPPFLTRVPPAAVRARPGRGASTSRGAGASTLGRATGPARAPFFAVTGAATVFGAATTGTAASGSERRPTVEGLTVSKGTATAINAAGRGPLVGARRASEAGARARRTSFRPPSPSIIGVFGLATPAPTPV